MPLAGRPLLEWSLLAIASSGLAGRAVVAVPAGSEEAARRSAEAAGLGGAVQLVPGGPSRAESVRRALGNVETELVVIHDAARPLAATALFDRVLRRLAADGSAAGAIAAAPIGDTLKRAAAAGEGALEVSATVERRDLWAAQTPQAFRVGPLREAQTAADAEGRLALATDEAALVEATGGRVLIEPAPTTNLKVTTGEDLSLAAALLAADRRV